MLWGWDYFCSLPLWHLAHGGPGPRLRFLGAADVHISRNYIFLLEEHSDSFTELADTVGIIRWLLHAKDSKFKIG